MKKLWLIIKREYLIRVRKKTFILTTLLTPLGFGLIMLVAGYMGAKSADSDASVLVKDESSIFESSNPESKTVKYTFSKQSLEELKGSYDSLGYGMFVYIPQFDDFSKTKYQIEYYSKEKPGLSTLESVERRVANAFKEHKISQSEIDRTVYESFRTDVTMENGAIDEEGGDNSHSSKLSIIIGSVLGGIMGFLMYMVIFIYGGMVMRSVMEEKINRIVEVMISAAKPFQMMLGKVIGVGGVGLTQLAIWIVLIPLMMMGIQLVFGIGSDPEQLQQLAAAGQELPQELDEYGMEQIFAEIKALNWWLILPVFVCFFFGGYFIYSTLFAAIGSAVGDDMGEAQQLMLPIIIPVIIAFVMLQGVIANPNGSMAVFGSLFPLFSPIIMPARLAFNPPVWQVILSIVILFGTCIFFAWIAARIYRVGILMYGKKVNLKEIGKWLFYKV